MMSLFIKQQPAIEYFLNKHKILKLQIILPVVSVIMFILGFYLPVVGIFIQILGIVPLIILVVIQGIVPSIASIVLASLLVKLTSGWIFSAFFFLCYGVFVCVIGAMARNNASLSKTIWIGSIVMFISLTVISSVPISNSDSILENFTKQLNKDMDVFVKNTGPKLEPQQLLTLRENTVKIIEFFKKTFVGWFFIFAVGITLICYIAATVLSVYFGVVIKPLPSFIYWKIPEIWLYIFLLGLTNSIIATFVDFWYLKVLGYNLLVVTLAGYLVVGFSIMYFFFNKWNMQMFGVILGLVIIFLSGFLLATVVGFGLFDTWFDFRKEKPRSESTC